MALIKFVRKILTVNRSVGWFLAQPVLWLFLFSYGSLNAQFFDANHPELVWQTIETEHFLVHYHQGTERTAQLVAEIAEEVYPSITGLYDYAPKEKVEFVIRDTEDYANGAAYFFDNKVEIWAENLDYILRGTHQWLRDVVTHEFTHIISLQKALKFGRHIPAGWFQLFGYEEERRPDVVRGFPNVLVSYPISGITIPVWFAEGVSQFQTPTHRYDYRDSHREMILRDRVITGNLLDFKEMGAFGKNSIGNESAYNQGFAFVRFLAQQFGDTVVAHLAAASRNPLTLTFDQAIKRATGVSAEKLYQQWKNHLEKTYDERLSIIREHQISGTPFADKGIGNLYPVVSPDGKSIAYTSTGDGDYLSQNQLIVENLENGEKKTIASRIAGSITWSPDGRYLAYSKPTPETGTGSLYNDIYIYDLSGEKEYRITRSLRARHPDWSHDGKRLVFVVQSDGLTNLFLLNIDNVKTLIEQDTFTPGYYHLDQHTIQLDKSIESHKNWHHHYRKFGFKGTGLIQITHFLNGRQVYHPRWAPGDEYIVFDTSTKFGRDIARIAPSGEHFSFILNSRCDERYPTFHPVTGELLYSCDETGIFNIYSLNLDTGERKALTNVTGGAFMATMSPSGSLFYSNYIHQGYRIYRIDHPQPIANENLTYIPDYPNLIPELSELTSPNPGKPARPYQNRFSGISFMPRLLVDYRTVKPGFYVYTNEMLNKMFFFGGMDVNRQKDYDLFGIFEFNLWRPTLFIEVFNQSANITDVATLEGYNVQPEIDVNFNLLEANVGLRGKFLPGKLSELFQSRLAYTYSWYRARIKSFSFVDPASNQLFEFAPLRYTYLRGHSLSLLLKHEHLFQDTDVAINPRRGRYVSIKLQREWNRFLDDFASDRVISIEKFKKYYFNRVEVNWEEYLTVPSTNRHTLSLQLRGGLIDTPVDSFFHFFAGGLVGLKGYPFYSIEGRKLLMGSLTYRFPLWRKINQQFLNIYFDKLYLGGFVQYGNAWSRGGIEPSNFLSDVGVQLRLDTFSWYFFPTRIFFEAAYPLQEHVNQGVRYPQEWKFYFGVLFDFNLRLENRFRKI
ncbi:MAG: hypothetical protein D6748_16560 [Calditrichaeota bacterium]|nr:MAG: hypothetical protein D6748_16560 [Calditrichota bacterium]